MLMMGSAPQTPLSHISYGVCSLVGAAALAGRALPHSLLSDGDLGLNPALLPLPCCALVKEQPVVLNSSLQPHMQCSPHPGSGEQGFLPRR